MLNLSNIDKSDNFSTGTSAGYIALTYAILSAFWIYAGDYLLLFYTHDPHLLTRIQNYKGIVFITFSAVLIFYLVRRSLSRLDRARQNIKRQAEELDRERALLRSIIDNIPLLITRYDSDANMMYLNKEFERCIGWSTQDNINLMETVFPDPEYRLQAIRYMEKASIEWREFNLITKNGKTLPSQWSNIRVEDGTQVGIGIDLTERLQAEARLRKKHEELEQFVYTISHDLKSPLITIRSFVGLVKEDCDKGNREGVKTGIHFISSASDKMEKLLSALLQLSRVGRKDSPPEKVSFTAIMDECRSILAGSLREKSVQLQVVDSSLNLHGDPLRLCQIWQNLIENAVKYMGDQAQPLIETGLVQKDGETVFYVRDNGIGIAPANLERIFDIFTRIKPEGEGVGLGLALVKKIVESCDGRIWAESAGPGLGSCFYFTLPKAVICEGDDNV